VELKVWERRREKKREQQRRRCKECGAEAHGMEKPQVS
jgi:ribosomal protein S14